MTEATHRPPPPVVRLRHSGPSMSSSSLPGIGAAKGAGAGGAGQGSDKAALYGYKLPAAQNSQNGTEPSTRERRLSALRRGGSGSAECAEEGGGGGENSGAGYKNQTGVDLAGVSDPSCSTRPPSPSPPPKLNSSIAADTATAITNTTSATASAPSPAYSLRSRPPLPESSAQAGPSTLVTAVPRQSRLRRTSASALASTSSASTTADASAGTMPRKPPAKPGKRRATAGRRRKAESDLESDYGSYTSSLSGGVSTPAGDADMDGSSGSGSGSDGSNSTSNGSGSRSSKGKGKAARTTRHGQSHSSRRNSNHTASRPAGQGYSHGRSTRATRNLDDEPLITLEDVTDELSAINAECRRCQVELREVEGDGSCFFRAVSQCLWGHQGHHELLRQATCDQMLENKEGLRVWEAGWGGSVEGLVNDMRKSSVFAHGPVLPALAEMIGWDLWLIQAEHSHRVVSANPNHPPHPRRISSPGFESLDIPAPEQDKTALWLAFQFKGTHYNSIGLPSGVDRSVGTGEGERGPQLSWIPDRYMQPHANDKSQEGQAWRARLASLKSKADGEGEGEGKGEGYRARLPSPATSADTTGTNTSGTDGTGDTAGTEGSGSTTTTEPASPAESVGSGSVPAAASAAASTSTASSASASATAPQSDGDTSTTSQATGSAIEFPSSPLSDHSVSSNSPRNLRVASIPRYSPEHAGTGSPKLSGKFKAEKQRSPVSPYARPISGQDPQQQQHQEQEARIEREQARERKRQEAREAREAEARRRRREAEALENDGFFIDDSPHRPKSHSHSRPTSSIPRSSTSRSKSQSHLQPQPQSRSRSSYDGQQAEVQEEHEQQELRRRALQRLQAVRARRGSGSAASVISVSSGGSSEDGMEVEAMIA